MSIQVAAEVAIAIGVILAVPLALYGIDAWRREAMWKRRSELCEEVLALCYEAREIISYMRAPGGFAGEGETRRPDEGESDSDRKTKNRAWIPIERHNSKLETLSRLWALHYRFRAQFGAEKSQPIEDLRDVINSVKSAAFILAEFWTKLNFNTMTPEQHKENAALVKKYEAIFYEVKTLDHLADDVVQPDEIQSKVNKAVSEIEQTCREVLHAQHTLYGMLNVAIFGRR